MKRIYNILSNVFGFAFISYISKKTITHTDNIIPIQFIDQIKCVEYYPLENAYVTVGETYNTLNYYTAKKRITNYTTIPINFAEILNDNNEIVMVNTIFFEKI